MANTYGAINAYEMWPNLKNIFFSLPLQKSQNLPYYTDHCIFTAGSKAGNSTEEGGRDIQKSTLKTNYQQIAFRGTIY